MNDEFFANIDSETLKAISGVSSVFAEMSSFSTCLGEVPNWGINALVGIDTSVGSAWVNPPSIDFGYSPTLIGLVEWGYDTTLSSVAGLFTSGFEKSLGSNLSIFANIFSAHNALQNVTGAFDVLRNQIPSILGVENLDELISHTISAEGGYLIRMYEWFLVPSLPQEFEDSLALLLDQNPSQAQIDEFYCNWFRENNFQRLCELIDGWNNPYFTRRKQAIQQVVEAHKMGWYDLSVHRMLSMIDAISFGFANSISPKQELSAWGAFQRLEERYIGHKLDFVLLRLTSYLIQEYVFLNTRRTPRRPILNRHLVLHEEDLNYGTEANSIRCFLLLHTLHYFISQSHWLVN